MNTQIIQTQPTSEREPRRKVIERANVVDAFFQVDMRKGHRGLRELAASRKINTEYLTPGHFVIFFNTKKDKAKVFAPFNTLVYVQLNNKSTFTPDIVANIPKAFDPHMRWSFAGKLQSVFKREFEIGASIEEVA